MTTATKEKSLQWDAPASLTIDGAPSNVALWTYCIRLGYADAARLLGRSLKTVRQACHRRFQERAARQKENLTQVDARTIDYMRFRPWRRCEDNDLIVALELGCSVDTIAADLMRSPGSVGNRIRELRENGRISQSLLQKIKRSRRPPMPTDRQIARLYALGNHAGLNHAAVKAELFERYGVDSSKDLLPWQYEAYCTDLQRRQRPEAGPVKDNAYSAPADMLEIAASARQFGRLWAHMNEDDVTLLAHLLNDWRLYRSRDRRLSQRQIDKLLDKLAAVPLPVFRRAATIWLERYRARNEKYFFGICQHVQADLAREAALQQQPLEFA